MERNFSIFLEVGIDIYPGSIAIPTDRFVGLRGYIVIHNGMLVITTNIPCINDYLISIHLKVSYLIVQHISVSFASSWLFLPSYVFSHAVSCVTSSYNVSLSPLIETD